MSASTSPSYDELKRRLEAAESALKAIREGRVDTILGEHEPLVVRLAKAEAREAHLKQVLLAIRNVNQLIVAEDDPRRLIERACVNLTETMGYHNAWITLLGGEAGQELGLPEAGPVAAAPGFEGGFESLRERLERGEFPECMARALASEDVLVVEDPVTDCPDCPLRSQYGGRAGLVRRLEYDGVTWGILTASVPAPYARDDEEQALFNEVAGDLAFALYKIAAAGKLEESRRRYREIFENSRDGFVMVDDSGRILDANGAYCEMLGYTLDELRALPDFYSITPARWHAWENEEIWWKRLLGQGCSGLYEKEYIRKDGSVFPVELRSYVVRRENGDIDYLWGTARDITQRKQTEDALTRQHAMLARTEALAHVGSWEWDIVSDHVRWSDELFRIFRRDPGKGAPSFAQHPEIYLPEDMQRLKKAVERCVTQGTPYELDLRAIRSDGEIRHCVARGQAETDEVGRIVRLAGSLQDLTEEKNLVREIENQRNRMESLMQAIPAPVFFKDKDGRYLGCNPAFETLTGSTQAQITGRTVHEVWPEKYSSTYRDKDLELIETGGSQQYEFNLVDAQGKERDVVFYKSAFKDQAGKIEGLVGVILDITERVKMQATVSHQSTMLDMAPLSITVHSKDGRFLYANQACLSMHGYTHDELMALPLSRLDSEESAALITERIRLLERDGQARFEVTHRRKDGTVFPLEVFARIVDWAGQTVLLSVASDITEHKQAEDALREAMLRQREAVKAGNVGLWDWDLKTDKVRYSAEWKRQIGYEEDEIGDGFEEWESRVHPDDLPETLEHVKQMIRDKAGAYLVEFRFRHKDGSYRWILAQATVLKDEHGEPVRTLGSHIDITERKKAEEALRESESRVRTKLNALLDPEGDIGALHLSDVVDCDEIQSLMNDFHALTDIGVGILDLEGTVLVGTGWQDVCTKFHRVHPETEKLCRESDTVLASGVEPGTFKIYKCKNNMWDMVTPIVIGGKHVGNLFLGQFFFADEAPDIAIFREQARRYGFDEEVYLKAYRAIPRWSRETVHRVMTFYCNLINVISRLSYAHIKLARSTEAFNAVNTKLTLAMEAAGQGLWEWNLITDVVHFDDAALDMLDYRREDIRGPMESGVWWMGRVHPGDRAFMEERFNRYVSGKEKDYHVEFRLKTKDGGYRWIDSSARLLSRDATGNPEIVVGIHLDITERKQAEEQQENLTTELEEILDALPDAVVYADTDRRIKKVNPSFTRIFGYSRDEILGKKTRIIYRNDEEYLEQGQKRYNPQALQMWEPYEIYHVRKDGTEFISETVGTPVRNAQGEVVGLLGLVRDVTDKKQREAENEKLQAQLRQAQKMEAVGRLAGGVAHDFNNMLSIVIGHADMILEEVKPDQPFYADLMEIRQAGVRSADLTRQLLAFARKQTVAPKVIDLNKTVESMLKMLQRLIGEDIDVAWIPGGKVWPVKIDPGQIDQILANLCVNARDAIAGVGKVTIETGNAVFDADDCRDHAGFAPGEYAMLAMSDNGCGMDAETLSHLFEPFFTTKDPGKGTGLGLATVYGVVKQNNGLINVYSEPGQGTTFKIYLPRHSATMTRFTDEGPNQPGKRGQETILIVEDEPAILRMTSMMLKREGYIVVEAGTPGEAIRLATEHAGDIHLLMTDVVMPEMNGRDLAKNILSLYPRLKCLFMSGYTANVIAHHGVLDEGINFIQKPFSKRELLVKMRKVLDKASDKTQR